MNYVEVNAARYTQTGEHTRGIGMHKALSVIIVFSYYKRKRDIGNEASWKSTD